MRLSLRVTPRASKSGIMGFEGAVLRARVHAAPADGEANDELIRLLSRELGVAKSAIRLLKGAASRNKILEIDGDEAILKRKLQDHAGNP